MFWFLSVSANSVGVAATTSSMAAARLASLRRCLPSPRHTPGLTAELLAPFESSASLNGALAQAQALAPTVGPAINGHTIEDCQSGFRNFYAPQFVQPYIPLAAEGPWIVTTEGAVVYDAGGYGMLGLGHNPAPVLAALSKPQTMANIMTPSLSHDKFNRRMREEIGNTRSDGAGYDKFMCLNSGSEAVGLVCRIIDASCRSRAERSADAMPVWMSLEGSFHGRTYEAGVVSDSCREAYSKHLASYNRPGLHAQHRKIRPNDVASLEAVFADASSASNYPAAIFLEAVMGEGKPGAPLTREFYDRARALCDESGAALVIDSVQAGFRWAPKRAPNRRPTVDHPNGLNG